MPVAEQPRRRARPRRVGRGERGGDLLGRAPAPRDAGARAPAPRRARGPALGRAHIPRPRRVPGRVDAGRARRSSLCLARPELLEERPRWGGGKPNAASLLLEPLAPEESEALARRAARRRAARRTERRASGSSRRPRATPSSSSSCLPWSAEREELGGERLIPPTIEALLAARLDRLGPGEGAVLEGASIVGKEFWPEAVGQLLPDEARPSRRPVISTALVRKQLLRPVGAREAQELFRFGHVLIQQAAYRSVPKELRSRVARALRRVARSRPDGGGIGELEELVGYHFEQASLRLAELGFVERPGARRSPTGRATCSWPLAAAQPRAAMIGPPPTSSDAPALSSPQGTRGCRLSRSRSRRRSTPRASSRRRRRCGSRRCRRPWRGETGAASGSRPSNSSGSGVSSSPSAGTPTRSGERHTRRSPSSRSSETTLASPEPGWFWPKWILRPVAMTLPRRRTRRGSPLRAGQGTSKRSAIS